MSWNWRVANNFWTLARIFFLSSGWLACAGNRATKVGSTLASLRMRTSRTGSPSYLERGVVTLGAAAAAGSGFTAAETGGEYDGTSWASAATHIPINARTTMWTARTTLNRMPRTHGSGNHDHIPGYGIWLLLVR